MNMIYLFGRRSGGYLYECHHELSFRYAQCGTLAAQTQSAMQTHWLQSLLPSPVCWPIRKQIPQSNKCYVPQCLIQEEDVKSFVLKSSSAKLSQREIICFSFFFFWLQSVKHIFSYEF